LLILVARLLPRAEYGTYITYMSLFEIIQLVSNIGLFPIAQRYVTDCRINGTQRQLIKLVSFTSLGRFVTLLAACGGLYLFSEQLLGFMGIPAARKSFILYLLVMLGEGVSRYLDLVFESLLLQGRAQISIFFRTASKLAAFASMAWAYGGITLDTLIELEAVTAAAGLGLSLLMITNYLWVRSGKPPATTAQRKYALSEMFGFSLRYYFAQIIGMLSSGDAIKLITARVLGVMEAASFGFSYSIYVVMLRYLPAYLLMGMLRPLFIAKHSSGSDFTEINNMANMVFKLNVFCITPLLAFLILYGTQFSSLLSGGKYPGAAGILVALCVLLVFQTLHMLLGLLAITIEKAQSALYGTILSTGGVIIGVYLTKDYGVSGLVAGLLLSEIFWCAAVWLSFYFTGVRFRLDWLALLKFIIVTAAVVFLLNKLNLPPSPNPMQMALVMGLVLFSCALLTYILKPFNARERATINRVLPKPLFVW